MDILTALKEAAANHEQIENNLNAMKIRELMPLINHYGLPIQNKEKMVRALATRIRQSVSVTRTFL